MTRPLIPGRILLAMTAVAVAIFSWATPMFAQDSTVRSEVAYLTDAAARAARLSLLRSAPLAEGDRELRLWFGFGIGLPNTVVRLSIPRAGEPRGEVILFYPSSMDTFPAFRVDLQRRCRSFRAVNGTTACREVLVASPPWRVLLDSLVYHHVWTLPDESVLPPSGYVVSDGVGLVVEARNGREYRAYRYFNPSQWTLAPAIDASAILDALGQFVYCSGLNAKPASGADCG